MKRSFILLIIILVTYSALMASGTNNPKDEIYSHIDRWHNLGLIDRLPPIRPYPAQYLISILEEIKLKGNADDIKIAEKYLEYYSGINLKQIFKHNSYSSLDEYQTISGYGIDGNIYLNKWVTAGIDINAFFINGVDNPVTAPNRSTGIDLNEDNMGIDAFGTYWEILQSLNLNGAVGNENYWFQTGMMSSSFGPLFTDSVVMNPTAKQAAHFSYTWIEDNFTLSYLFMPIVATDNTGDNESDNKFIHIRSLDFKLTDWWEFQFYETAIYGGKGVKPIFFLPFSEFFYSAGQGGTWDVNSLMGLSSRFQLPQNISLKGTIYMDDINAKDIVKLNLNTRYKLAAQFEVDWTPKESLINSISLGYTAITPYMYTHTTEADEQSDYFDIFDTDYDIRSYALSEYMNYENYTNGGLSMGPYGMEPNSDKISFNMSLNIPFGFQLKFNSEIQRHGNSSSSADREYDTSILEGLSDADIEQFYEDYDVDRDGIIDDSVALDGSIFDAGYGWTGGYQYKDSTPFLTQDVLEIQFINELTLLSPKLDIGKGQLYGKLSYAYVYIKNIDLVEDDNFTGSYINFSLNYAL